MGKQEEQGSALPLEELFDATAVERADEAVIDYLRDLLAIYLSDGSLEGEPAEVSEREVAPWMSNRRRRSLLDPLSDSAAGL
jgi:hypothetical protein